MRDESEEVRQRRKRGLSIEWQKYPGTEIEVFFDSAAILYRIDGKIHAVPRYLPVINPEDSAAS